MLLDFFGFFVLRKMKYEHTNSKTIVSEGTIFRSLLSKFFFGRYDAVNKAYSKSRNHHIKILQMDIFFASELFLENGNKHLKVVSSLSKVMSQATDNSIQVTIKFSLVIHKRIECRTYVAAAIVSSERSFRSFISSENLTESSRCGRN